MISVDYEKMGIKKPDSKPNPNSSVKIFSAKQAVGLYNETMRDKVYNFIEEKSWIFDQIKMACYGGRRYTNVNRLTSEDKDCLRHMGYTIREYDIKDCISW